MEERFFDRENIDRTALKQRISIESGQRDLNYWSTFNPSCVFKPILPGIQIVSTDSHPEYVIRRKTTDGKHTIKTHYHVYAAPVSWQSLKPKGVIIKVYGAGSKQEITNKLESEELVYAQQGYIVYVPNFRGTKGYGNKFEKDKGVAKGTQSLVRDTTYLAYLLKEQKTDMAGKRPFFADLITQDLPFFLTGASFGGYLTLHNATNKEQVFCFRGEHGIVKRRHQDMFDGYIATMPVSNVLYDIESGTSAGNLRQSHFTALNNGWISTSVNWMENAHQNFNALEDNDNSKISPSENTDSLEKPVLLLHGLKDDNTSPKQSIKFADSAVTNGKGHFVGVSYLSFLGHEYARRYPNTRMYFEPILKFMDAVRFAKQNGRVFTFDALQQAETAEISNAAKFRMRIIHPGKLRRPQEILLNTMVNRYFQYYNMPCGTTIDSQAFSTSFDTLLNASPREFLKAVLYLTRKDQFPTKGTYGKETLQRIKERNDAYENDVRALLIDGIVLSLDQYFSISYPSSSFMKTTHGDEFLKYLGNGDYLKGLTAYDKAKETLRRQFMEFTQIKLQQQHWYLADIPQLSTSY